MRIGTGGRLQRETDPAAAAKTIQKNFSVLIEHPGAAASGAELESFILRKRGASWDSMPIPGFTINDIDEGLVEKFKILAIKKGRIDPSGIYHPSRRYHDSFYRC